jgi:hypothetical protein
MPRKSTAARPSRQISPSDRPGNRTIDESQGVTTTKICCYCQIEKDVSDFYLRKDRPGLYGSSCKTCLSRSANARTKAKRAAKRASYPDVPPGMVGENTTIIDADGHDWSWAFPRFREIPNFPGYGVGENGTAWTRRVSGRGIKFGRWKKLDPFPSKKGPLLVGIWVDGRKKNKTLHSLVMLSFVGPRPDGLEVCHNNGSYTDNWLCNLRYDTHTANEADKVKHGTRPKGERVYAAKLNPEKVMAIRQRYQTGEESSQLIKEFGICDATFRSIVKRKTWAWVGDKE